MHFYFTEIQDSLHGETSDVILWTSVFNFYLFSGVKQPSYEFHAVHSCGCDFKL
jgi:hypothetical protein